MWPLAFASFCIALLSHQGTALAATIADHTSTDLTQVPVQYINAAKANLKIWYGHTSHGHQITVGMEGLRDHYGAQFQFNESGAGGALSYQETYGDLGYEFDTAWAEATREQLNDPGNDRNVVMWSWCGGVSAQSSAGINFYCQTMNQLEIDFPGVLFVYMTGHLDGTGPGGNLHQRNEQIRSFCRNNNKILFDFADIESYDPDGQNFLNLNADDGCYYDGGNWAQQWCAAHAGSDLCWPCECDHSEPLNCNLKGRAFWWLLARMAGWGSSGTPTPTPTIGPDTPTPTTVPPTETPIPTATPTAGPGSPTPTQPWPTPTQICDTPTPGPTATPWLNSPTPEPTPSDTCDVTGVTLWMPAQLFWPGANCSLRALVCNTTEQPFTENPLFVILDVFGSYWFAPTWSTEFDKYRWEFAPGLSTVDVIQPFAWPADVGAGSGIVFWGALTDPSVTQVFGEFDSWTFGWRP